MPLLSRAPDRTGPGSRSAPLAVTAAAVGALPGMVLGTAAGVAAWLRRTKPLHPRGFAGPATLTVTSPQPALDIPLLAAPGTHSCLARWSRAAGLPQPLPDVEGFALRFEDPTADLLFASTGTGVLARHVLLPRLPSQHGPQTTLLPVGCRAGAVTFRVQPTAADREPPSTWTFSVARTGGPWRHVGVVRVEWAADQAVRFDPVENLLPGTRQYPLVRTLREPAYRLARVGADA